MTGKTTILLTFLLLPLLFASCGGKEEATVPEPLTTATAPRLVIGASDADRTQVIYSMPTPNELFELIKGMDVAVDKNVLYDVSMAKTAEDTLTKAFRFGLCATDLVYASYFDIPTEVVRYYLTTKQMSKTIGLDKAFNSIDVKRLQRNITHGDSLTILTNEAYLKAYELLDEEEQGDVLAMVLAGGWVETTYLLIEQIGDYDAENALLDRLAEQKVGLSQLVDLMELNADSREIIDVRTKLLAIRDVFDHLGVTRVKENSDKLGGRRVLGGEETFKINALKFEEIRNAVLQLRGNNHNF